MEAVGLLIGGLFCIGIPVAGLIIGVKIGLKRRRHGPGLREQAAVSSQFINSNVEIRTAAPGPEVIDELQRAVPMAIGNWDRVLVTALSVSPAWHRVCRPHPLGHGEVAAPDRCLI